MDDIQQDTQQSEQKTIGNEVDVRFVAFNKSVPGKVDTGATTSSLNAQQISTSRDGSKVSFQSPALGGNVITLDVASHQEVHSADGGGNERPVVKMEVEIDGVSLGPVEFNLNDRSEMDNDILIGQNILKAGNFIIDVQKNDVDTEEPQLPVDNSSRIREAINVLRDSNVTLNEIMTYLQTEAVNRIQ
jgi:hypothetical protein